MRRSFFLSLVLVFSFFMSAPHVQAQYSDQPGKCSKVQNTFFGCKLGVSTYQEVLNNLKSHSFDVSDREKNIYIVVYDIVFGDMLFDMMKLIFKEGKLSSVKFEYGKDSYASANQMMENLNNVVKRTYPSLKRTNPTASAELIRYSATDGKRMVVVNLTHEESVLGDMLFYTKLIYYDIALNNKPNKGL